MRAPWMPVLAAATGLAACGSSPPPPPPDHAVWQLQSLNTAKAAWAAAARADQPLLIVGSTIYGLAPECVPQRFYSTRDGARQLGSAADARQQGAQADQRLQGAAQDQRSMGAASDQRLTGAAQDARLTGAAQDERAFGGDDRGRHFGSELVRRDFGAVESALRCRLAGSTLLVTGTGGRPGYLYSARLRGALDGVVLR
jgi:hypothetical protein